MDRLDQIIRELSPGQSHEFSFLLDLLEVLETAGGFEHHPTISEILSIVSSVNDDNSDGAASA